MSRFASVAICAQAPSRPPGSYTGLDEFVFSLWRETTFVSLWLWNNPDLLFYFGADLDVSDVVRCQSVLAPVATQRMQILFILLFSALSAAGSSAHRARGRDFPPPGVGSGPGADIPKPGFGFPAPRAGIPAPGVNQLHQYVNVLAVGLHAAGEAPAKG